MGLSNQFETSIVFDWSEFDLAKLLRKSYRKPSIDTSCQISLNFAKRFQRRKFKSVKLTHDGRLWWQKLTRIKQKIWSPWTILVSDWLKLRKSSLKLACTQLLLLYRNDVWEVLYTTSIFRAYWTTKMVVIGSSSLWLLN
jgi:hypothetical protein